MARRTKADKNVEKLMAFLTANGAATPKAEEIKAAVRQHKQPLSRGLDGIAQAIKRPGDWQFKICQWYTCKQPFGTDYTAVAYCTDKCRAAAFEHATGLKFFATAKTPEERWGGEVPLVIPTEILARMIPLARRIVEAYDEYEIPPVDTQEDPQIPEESSEPQLTALHPIDEFRSEQTKNSQEFDFDLAIPPLELDELEEFPPLNF